MTSSPSIGRAWRALLPALLVALSFGLSGCSRQSDTDLLASAKSLLDKNDARAASIQLKAALQRNPNLAEARFLLGKTLLDGGDATAAEVELQKALDLHYDDNDVIPELARALQAQGQYRKIVDLFGRTRLQDAKSAADLRTTVADAWNQLGQRDRGSQALQDALAAAPTFAPALLLKARLAGEAGRYPEAISIADDVLARDPRNFVAWAIKGIALAAGGAEPAQAMDAFKRSIEINPRYVYSYTAIMTLAQRQGDMKTFEAQAAALKKALPNHPVARFYEAQVLLYQREYGKAREIVQALLRRSPESVPVLQLAGAIELFDRKPVQAEQHLAKAVKLDPDAPLAKRLLAQTYLGTGQTDKALAILEPMTASQSAPAEVLSLTAEAKLLDGDARGATELFARAAKADPTDPKVRTALALIRLRKGDTEAFADLESVASQDKGGYADLALISARLQAGQLDKAMAALDVLDKKTPNRAALATLRGRIELRRKNVAAARASFDKALQIEPTFLPAAAALTALDIQDKHLDQAEQRFQGILKIQPRNVAARLAIVDLKARQGLPAPEVDKLIAEAARLNPVEATPWLLLINRRIASGDFKGAESAATEAVAANSNEPRLLVALGNAQFGAGDKQQALNTFGKLVNQFPNLPDSYLRLADVQVALNDLQNADRTLVRMLDVAPGNIQAQLARVAVASAAGHSADALERARDIQKTHAKAAIGWVKEGELHFQQGQWVKAQAAFKEALSREPSSANAIRLHNAMLRSMAPGAEPFASQWIKDHPKDAVFQSHLGVVSLADGKFGDAERWLRASVQAQPTYAVGWNNLAQALLGQKKSALDAAKRANDLAPRQPAIMDTLAMALAADKQFPQALDVQRQAIGMVPQDAGLRLNLARILIDSGDKAAARAELEKIKAGGEKAPGYAAAVKLLGTLP